MHKPKCIDLIQLLSTVHFVLPIDLTSWPPHSKTAMVQSRSFYSIIFMQMTNAVECRQSSQKPACFKVRSLYSGVAKGDLGVKPPHWLREKDIFHVEMLHFPFVTKITTLNNMLTNYQIFDINPNPHHKFLATPLSL